MPSGAPAYPAGGPPRAYPTPRTAPPPAAYPQPFAYAPQTTAYAPPPGAYAPPPSFAYLPPLLPRPTPGPTLQVAAPIEPSRGEAVVAAMSSLKAALERATGVDAVGDARSAARAAFAGAKIKFSGTSATHTQVDYGRFARWILGANVQKHATPQTVVVATGDFRASSKSQFVLSSTDFDLLIEADDFALATDRARTANPLPLRSVLPTELAHLEGQAAVFTGVKTHEAMKYGDVLRCMGGSVSTEVITSDKALKSSEPLTLTTLVIRRDAACCNSKTRLAAMDGIPMITMQELVAILAAGAVPSPQAAPVPPLQLGACAGAATSQSPNASGPTARLPRLPTAQPQSPPSPLASQRCDLDAPTSPLDGLDAALPPAEPPKSRSRHKREKARRRRPPAGSEAEGPVRSITFGDLLDMGFDRDAAEAAVVAYGGDATRALDALCLHDG